MFSPRVGLLLTSALCVLMMSLLAQPGQVRLTDEVLSQSRGANKQVFSKGCISCAGLAVNLQPATIDECRCQGNVDLFCTTCPGSGETSQQLQQGNPPGNPGWLAGNLETCGGNIETGQCLADGSCGMLVNAGICLSSLQIYNQETH